MVVNVNLNIMHYERMRVRELIHSIYIFSQGDPSKVIFRSFMEFSPPADKFVHARYLDTSVRLNYLSHQLNSLQ